jgi:transposase
MGARKLSAAQRQRCFELDNGTRTLAQIERKLNCCEATVKRWIAEGKKRRPCWADAPRSGRPPKLGAAMRARVRRSVRRGSTVPLIMKRLSHSTSVSVSDSTVRRMLKAGALPLAWVAQQ